MEKSEAGAFPIEEDPKARRRVPRRAMRERIGILVGGRYGLGLALEIGEGGVLIESPLTLVNGQRVVVTLRIPGILTGVILGHVVYRYDTPDNSKNGHDRYGIEFDQISFEFKRKIRLYVASSNSELSRRSETVVNE